jgi:predicted secreted hydrolase
MGVELVLEALKDPVIHGREGVSLKAAGEGYASHYYSLTRMRAAGTLLWEGRSYEVRGQAWMDHEFGSNQLRDYQVGWDWFGIQLDNDTELMLYLIRHRDGTIDPASSGTLVHADGEWEHLALSSFRVEALGSWRSESSAATYPSGWLVKVPRRELELRLTPTLKDQELTTRRSTMVTYWEGSVLVNGRLEGVAVAGRGYVELTGYAEAFRPRI